MPKKRSFVGFGFGAIQSGLFLDEAFRSGNFERYAVAEVMNDVVAAVRSAGGAFTVNSAAKDRIERRRVEGVEIYNPNENADREALVDADELSTALPSVKFFDDGADSSVAGILAAGLRKKLRAAKPKRCILYAAENHNHAAEILEEAIHKRLDSDEILKLKDVCQFLNTVIGKMSRVVSDAKEIAECRLEPMTPGNSRAFLVEEFNRILITEIALPKFRRGITVFKEKPNLLPFEEAKLYGHNATHALIGFLANVTGCTFISDATEFENIMILAREAFIEESGAALCKKHAGLDRLFTPNGYRVYADDLLERMVNPHLRDTVARVTRDPRRKLGWDDRLIGTMRACLEQGIAPERYALGAAAAVKMIRDTEADAKGKTSEELLEGLFAGADAEMKRRVMALILNKEKLLAEF